MKKGFLLLGGIFLTGVILVMVLIKGNTIQNPSPAECEIIELTVKEISEGGVKDIVFKENSSDLYYINRGLEQGFTIEELEDKVLNKKVTLHLVNTWMGTSNHIAQVALGEEIIFTEFN